MSTIYLRGSRANLAGLLRLMADEIASGEQRSATSFASEPGWDPENSLVVEVVDEQRNDTTMKVFR